MVLLAVGIFLKTKNKKEVNPQQVVDNATTTEKTKIIDLNSGGGEGYKIEQVPIESKTVRVPAPSLDKPIVFSSQYNYTDEVKKMYTDKINSLKDQIRSNPNTLLPWIDLGSYEKSIGNYANALEDWTYVSKSAPTDYISLGNIGNLYAYYLKDNAMAEVYYKKAIQNGPKQTYLYIQLAEVYRDVFKDNAKATSIIDQGLKLLPNDLSLLDFKKNIK